MKKRSSKKDRGSKSPTTPNDRGEPKIIKKDSSPIN